MAIKQTARVLVVVTFVSAIVLAGYEIFFWFTHVYEDDARIQTEVTNISPQVNGKINAILVEEGSLVTKGQLLVKLEEKDIRLGIKALKTDLLLKQAERSRLKSEKQVFETELLSKLETQKQKIGTVNLEHQSIQGRLGLAEKNLERFKFLFKKDLISEEKFTREKDKVLILRGDASHSKARIEVSKREYNQLQATSRQSEVILEKIKILDVQQERIKDAIKLEELSLSYRHITSPIDGIVGRVHRYPGEYIEDGVNILMLHDPTQFWIEAYVDESQIRHIQIGKAVLIDFEAYPFHDFYGLVEHVGNITTSEMGLETFSSKNQFGGGVERVPVRISIKNPPATLTPGMQASVNIRIYDSIKLW